MYIIGASLSEPHTSELALEFALYYISYVLIIVVFLCDDHLVTLHHSAVDAHAYTNMCYKLRKRRSRNLETMLAQRKEFLKRRIADAS